MKFRVVSAKMEDSVNEYACIAGVSNKFKSNPVVLDVNITVTDFNSDEVDSLNSIEDALKQKEYPYDWLTDEKLEYALKKTYPEMFL